MLKPDLEKAILENSNSEEVFYAVREWDVIAATIDESQESVCVCNQEGLKYLYTIGNRNTGATLFPIGSSCVEKFGVQTLNNQIKSHRKLIDLILDYRDRNGFIDPTLEMFSPSILEEMYYDGCFVATKYNGYDPSLDYKFILKTRRMRTSPSYRQTKKVTAIIMGQIKPYLDKKMKMYGIKMSRSRG